MAAPSISGFSLAALALREALLKGLSVGQDGSPLGVNGLRIGAPAQATLGVATILNLFFYRAETGAFPSDAGPNDPFYVRLFCLITAFGHNTGTTGPSAGEIELQLIGKVMEFFHKNPTLLVTTADKPPAPLASLQVVFTPLTLEAMNNLWSTQKETAYRLSVAYELSLVPAQATPTAPTPGPLVLEVQVNAPPFHEPTPPQLELALLVGNARQHSLRLAPSNVSTVLKLTAYADEDATFTIQWTWWPHTRGAPAPLGLTAATFSVQGPLVQSWSAPREITVTPRDGGQLVLWATATTAHGVLPTNRVTVLIVEPTLGGSG
jgi:hypothetical protein